MALAASPQEYILDQARSKVRFTYEFEGQQIKGEMPIHSARITLDLDEPANSEILVFLDPTQAQAGFPIATQLMKGDDVLAASRFPRIIFKSQTLTGGFNQATLRGAITVRDVTRSLSLSAQVFRQRSDEDLSQLTVYLTGQLDRHAFGANGFADMVGPLLDIEIIARISRLP